MFLAALGDKKKIVVRTMRQIKQFLLQRSQQIPVDGLLRNEKAFNYAKEFNLPDFKASDG